MKKQSIVLLLSASLLLVGCGSSSNGVVPTGAKEVDITSATKGLSTAATALSNSDSFGISIDKANMSLTADVSNGGAYCANISCTYYMNSYTIDVTAKDMSLALNAKGLQSSTVNDVAASITGSGSINGSVTMPSSKQGVSTNVTFDYTDMNVGAYLKNGTAYADLSSESFLSLVGMVYSIFSSSASGSFSLNPGKYTTGEGFLTASSLPLVSESMKTSIASSVSSIAEVIESYSSFVKSYSYDNGNYALDLTLTKDNIASFINEAEGTASSSVSSLPTSAANMADVFVSFLNITSCEMCVVYGNEGLVSFETNIDVSVDTTLGDISDKLLSASAIDSSNTIPDTYRSTKEKIAFKSACKINFLTGDDVKVTYPSDLDSYASVSED